MVTFDVMSCLRAASENSPFCTGTECSSTLLTLEESVMAESTSYTSSDERTSRFINLGVKISRITHYITSGKYVEGLSEEDCTFPIEEVFVSRKVTRAKQALISYLNEKRGSFLFKCNLLKIVRMNTSS